MLKANLTLTLTAFALASCLLAGAPALAQDEPQSPAATQTIKSCDQIRNTTEPRVVSIQVSDGQVSIDMGACGTAIVDGQVIESDGDVTTSHKVFISHAAMVAIYQSYADVRFDGVGDLSYMQYSGASDDEIKAGFPTAHFHGQGSFGLGFYALEYNDPSDLPRNWLIIHEGGSYIISNWTRVLVDGQADVFATNIFRLHADDGATVALHKCWEGSAGTGSTLNADCDHLNKLDDSAKIGTFTTNTSPVKRVP